MKTTATEMAMFSRDPAAPGRPVLVVVHHPDRRFVGVRRLLEPGEVLSIGREARSLGTGVLNLGKISRKHAEIRALDAAISIADLGSHNGTWVNGRKIVRSGLNDGDVIAVGPLLLMLRIAADVPMAQPDINSVGISATWLDVMEQCRQVAKRDTTVLVSGETGVGKERVVRAIHRNSGRAGDLVAVDCGALTDALIASELFGHVAGAFPGAESDQQGQVEAAEGGTLFLDEIGAAPPEMQAALLRFLDTRQYRTLGTNVQRSANVRVIASTNADLPAAVDAGTFRGDLYARLSGWAVAVPPLRARAEDIGVLAHHLANEMAPQAVSLHRDLVMALLLHPWRGNVWELRHVMERIVVEAGTDAELRLPDWWDLEIAQATTEIAAPSLADGAETGLKLRAGVAHLTQGHMMREGQRVTLSTKECALLRFMSENIDRLITRDELLVEVWGYSAEVVTRAADTTMCRLRSKIEIDAAAPDHLLTIYGEGYRFMPL